IRSLLNQALDRSEYEIIVVDGNSTDKTVRISRKLGAKVYHENKGSIGHARNVGAKNGRGKIVAFLDADCIAPRGWLLRIKKTFSRKPELKGLGGFGVPINGRWQDRLAFVIINYYCKLASWLGLYQFSGYNCVFKREDFLESGGFNPEIKYLEDSEFSIRFSGGGKRKCKFSRRLTVFVSPRRLVQMGVLKSGFLCVFGYFCLIIKKKFPWDYSKLIYKWGLLDR
ncbi:MAG: glycosyltransferase, partial [archaeon]